MSIMTRRLPFIAAALALGLSSLPAEAGPSREPFFRLTPGDTWSGRYNFPWCAAITFDQTNPECAYDTQAQCLATVWGVGGYCTPNPWYVERPRRKSHKHRP